MLRIKLLVLVLFFASPLLLSAQSNSYSGDPKLDAIINDYIDASNNYDDDRYQTTTESLESLKEYAARHPKSSQALLYIGRIFDRLSNPNMGLVEDANLLKAYFDSSIQFYKAAYKLNPDLKEKEHGFSIPQLISHSYALLGVQEYQKGNLAEAKKRLQMAKDEGGFSPALLALGRAYLESCDLNAILLVHGDDDTFPLYYLQLVEKFRTDVSIVNTSLLNVKEYAQRIHDGVKGVVAPVRFEMPTSEEWDYTKRDELDSITAVIQPSAQGLARLQQMGFGSEELQPVTLFSAGGGILTNDVKIVLNILKANAWERPVYTGENGSSYASIAALGRHEGVAIQILPFHKSAGENMLMDNWIDANKEARILTNPTFLNAVKMDHTVASPRATAIMELARLFAKASDPSIQRVALQTLLDFDVTTMSPFEYSFFILALESSAEDRQLGKFRNLIATLPAAVDKPSSRTVLDKLLLFILYNELGECPKAKKIAAQLDKAVDRTQDDWERAMISRTKSFYETSPCLPGK